MDKFYTHTTKIHNTRSASIVVPYILEIVPAKSVLDVGCGIGTWLKIFNDNFGVKDILGLDGAYVNRKQLVIDETYFKSVDLRKSFDLNRKFDLVVCLEVAEHLPEQCAVDFIASLCRHSDSIIFSSAIPGQGGQNHLNEQWISYWESIFQKNGFSLVDIIRPKIWNEVDVDVWYRQNMFLFVKEEGLIQNNHSVQMAEIHPALWKMKIDTINRLYEEVDGFEKGHAGIKRSFNALINAVLNKFRIR